MNPNVCLCVCIWYFFSLLFFSTVVHVPITWGLPIGQLKGQATQYSVQLVKQVDRGYPRALLFIEMRKMGFLFDFP